MILQVSAYGEANQFERHFSNSFLSSPFFCWLTNQLLLEWHFLQMKLHGEEHESE